MHEVGTHSKVLAGERGGFATAAIALTPFRYRVGATCLPTNTEEFLKKKVWSLKNYPITQVCLQQFQKTNTEPELNCLNGFC